MSIPNPFKLHVRASTPLPKASAEEYLAYHHGEHPAFEYARHYQRAGLSYSEAYKKVDQDVKTGNLEGFQAREVKVMLRKIYGGN